MPVCENLFKVQDELLTFLRPVKALWTANPDFPYTCINKTAYIIASSTLNTLTDILCTLAPVMVVMNLRMPTRQKVVTASLFLLAITADIASILRIYYSVLQGKSGDTWDLYSAGLCGVFEMGLGQLCVSIPTLKPLLAKFVSKFDYSSNEQSPKNYYNSYDSQRPRDALVRDSCCRSDQPRAQQPRIYTDIDSNKSLNDEKFPGIKVMYTFEMGSMDLD